MSSFATIDSLSLSTPDGHTLFSGLTLALGRERTGLVGRNGCGKSTLLRLIAGQDVPVAGSLSASGSIAMLRQRWDEPGLTADAALGVAEGLARLARLEAGDGSVEDAAEADWTLEERLGEALRETGFVPDDLHRPVASFSGGERTRLGIARLLLDAPDLLLLDEPTNNLDAEGRAAVMRLIAGWPGGVLVASHDRALLEGMDRIVELTPVGCTVFGGGWSEFVSARDAAREAAEDALDRAQRDRRATARAVQEQAERKARRDRMGRSERARGDQPKILLDARKDRSERTSGRDSRLAGRMTGDADAALADAQAKVEIVTPLRIELPRCGLPANRIVLAAEALCLDLGARRLFGPLSFTLTGPERVAIAGPNGSGKSSLLRLVSGETAPTSGSVSTGDVPMAMLDQHVGLLDGDASILDNLRRIHPGLSENDARTALARFAFRNRAGERLVASLSGGERLRAGLAAVFSGPVVPQLLILDEPTNHLDIDTVELLEAALAEYDGALLVVSHDAAFLQAIGVTRTIAIG
ncbi:ABC-F family ATP-binding cassette domain-containing protein [Stakelama tenebrarum]|uniref:ABC-F family ATP-binding cassette domain-containing protein n=1 Tax=Stakelama tenebrarum TaxID=2711215 RepID=A0A6G6Y2G4_9SPHN|nr:ABC-F family ATP-binding cassette domain-containing protein [Sphingosinithalassobacter tenebrarum]QIG79090.1 ABC-F family ATP-binding cassette domain-containing protein [Sphingosinithalassobacter tenebrarum]